jgi:hypothetical protein
VTQQGDGVGQALTIAEHEHGQGTRLADQGEDALPAARPVVRGERRHDGVVVPVGEPRQRLLGRADGAQLVAGLPQHRADLSAQLGVGLDQEHPLGLRRDGHPAGFRDNSVSLAHPEN